MRAKLNKYKFIILAVFLMTGVSISGWAITSHYNQTAKSTDSQEAPKNGSQSANIVSGAINHGNTILLLVCTGLIGFISVRRQSKKRENLVN